MLPRQIPQFLIGAATSNSGKTTLTMGLLRALQLRGMNTQPYKCGPDYIDPKYHALAAGRESVNLDTWLGSSQHVCDLYGHYAQGADALVAEGVMGLFDGYDKKCGSSAEVAQLLHLPVVLVVNARSMAYSAAPLLYGFKHFDPSVEVCGVIFNQIASESHYRFLQEACLDAGLNCYGYLSRLKEIEVPSRHLGLTLDNLSLIDGYAQRIAEALEQTCDLDRLLADCTRPIPAPPSNFLTPQSAAPLRIAVAHDEAFNFTYRYNIDKLKTYGEIAYFSPIRDAELPPCDLLYLPGGYPEFYLSELTANGSLRTQIRAYIEGGGHTWAECGGMMYLCESIVGMDGITYPMVGVIPHQATMQGMRLHLGYRHCQVEGKLMRGHEFHYSDLVTPLPSAVQQYAAKGNAVDTALYRYKNLTAGYTHWYLFTNYPR